MKVTTVYCDLCGSETNIKNPMRIDLLEYTTATYPVGYRRFEHYEMCEKCYSKLRLLLDTLKERD